MVMSPLLKRTFRIFEFSEMVLLPSYDPTAGGGRRPAYGSTWRWHRYPQIYCTVPNKERGILDMWFVAGEGKELDSGAS